LKVPSLTQGALRDPGLCCRTPLGFASIRSTFKFPFRLWQSRLKRTS
jgi:hypothetical protein